MKKIIALLTLFALILTFAACAGDSAKGGDGTSENGGADTSVPVATLDGRDEITVKADLTVDGVTMPQTFSFLNAGEIKLYYAVSDNGLEQYFVEDAEGVKRYSRLGGQTGFASGLMDENAEDPVPPLTLFGFGADKYLGSLTGNKTGEEKVGEFDCDVYDIKYTDAGIEYASRIWADKDSGIWVKNTFEDEYGAEVAYTVTSITDKCADMPSTVPVKVSEGQIYSESGLTINLKGIDFNPNYAATLDLEAVNSTDSALKVKSKYFDVNGFCIGGNVFNISVPAGQSLVFEIQIPDSSCEAAGIDMIEEMVFAVSAEKYHTENDGEGNYDVSDGMLIPRSEEIKITTVCPVELPKEESGERRVLCSTPDFDVYFGGIKENASGGYDFIVYYESEFSEDIRVTANIHEVNGVAYDDFEKIYVYAGRKGFGGFSFWKDKVTEKPATVKLSFEAYYGELYNGTCILEETEPFVLTVG